jgi:hypothetical protein
LLLIERMKIFHQSAALRLLNLIHLSANPAGARRIPFQLAVNSRVRECL